jgi:hypothetical protein
VDDADGESKSDALPWALVPLTAKKAAANAKKAAIAAHKAIAAATKKSTTAEKAVVEAERATTSKKTAGRTRSMKAATASGHDKDGATPIASSSTAANASLKLKPVKNADKDTKKVGPTPHKRM